MPVVRQVAILGLGLIGGSLGMALRSARFSETVVGWDISPETVATAVHSGAVDRGYATLRDAVSATDLAILCTPLASIPRLIADTASWLSHKAVLTDVGSVKSRIVEVGDHECPGRFVGGHPLAGLEQSGISSAISTLFRGTHWLITPGPRTQGDAISIVSTMAASIGAEPCILSAAEHDSLVACVSHLPHALAFALVQSAEDHGPEGLRDLIGGSFRDGSRVAASSPEMWTQILLENRTAVAPVMESAERWLRELRIALMNGDEMSVRGILESARRAKGQFPKAGM